MKSAKKKYVRILDLSKQCYYIKRVVLNMGQSNSCYCDTHYNKNFFSLSNLLFVFAQSYQFNE